MRNILNISIWSTWDVKSILTDTRITNSKYHLQVILSRRAKTEKQSTESYDFERSPHDALLFLEYMFDYAIHAKLTFFLLPDLY